MARNEQDEIEAYGVEIDKWAKTRTTKKNERRQDASVVAFLNVKAKVERGLAKGYSITTIWDHMTETNRITTSYETFRRHVMKFILNAPPADEPSSAGEKPHNHQTKQGGGAGVSKAKSPKELQPVNKKPEATGFAFSPQPKKEDLL